MLYVHFTALSLGALGLQLIIINAIAHPITGNAIISGISTINLSTSK